MLHACVQRFDVTENLKKFGIQTGPKISCCCPRSEWPDRQAMDRQTSVPAPVVAMCQAMHAMQRERERDTEAWN